MTLIRVLYLAPQDEGDLPGLPRGTATIHRCADLADLLGRALAGSAEVAVLSPRSAGIDAVALSRLRATGCRVVGLRGPEDQWQQWGVPAVDRTAPELLAACQERAPRQLPVPVEPISHPAGRIVCIWGPPGAPGRTTVAGLLAASAAQVQSVLLVDADLAGGQWAMLSGQAVWRSGLILASRRAAAGSLRPGDIGALAKPYRGFTVLSGIGDPNRWAEVDPTDLRAVLAVAAHGYDLVVVDVAADVRAPHPALAAHWAHDVAAVGRAALEVADLTVAVLRADPMGVQRFASWWPMVADAGTQLLVVANGCDRVPSELGRVLGALGWTEPAVAVPMHPTVQVSELRLAVARKLGRHEEPAAEAKGRQSSRSWTRKMVRGSLKYGNQGASRV